MGIMQYVHIHVQMMTFSKFQANTCHKQSQLSSAPISSIYWNLNHLQNDQWNCSKECELKNEGTATVVTWVFIIEKLIYDDEWWMKKLYTLWSKKNDPKARRRNKFTSSETHKKNIIRKGSSSMTMDENCDHG